MNEPLLNDEDLRIWERWRRVCLLHARTAGHRRRIEAAQALVRQMASRCPGAYLAWSAGKDSTAMAHLASAQLPTPRAMSIKDDCDFPGEVEYLERLASEWGVRLDIVRPAFSLRARLAELQASPGEDLHSRAATFSDEAFYGLIDAYRHAHGLPGVYLGLRKEESHARLMHRARRGAIYTKRDGETVCMPLCDWSDKDVYAYLFTCGIEPLHVYRCVRLASSPGSVRKSWWVPGSGARYGQVVWLRTYYPSLYAELRRIMPGVAAYA